MSKEIVQIKGDINESTLLAVQNALSKKPDNIELRIDSLGGQLQTGLHIADLLRTTPNLILNAVVEGNCASSATLILMAVPLENRLAFPNATFLIHSPLANVGYSNLKDVKALQTEMETALTQLKNLYLQRTKMGEELIDSYIQNERTFYADEAVRIGFIGGIVTLYNKIYNYNKKQKIMKKNFINTLVNKLVKALLNENYVTEDGSEVTIDGEIAIGTPANPDGVWVIDGATITVEGGSIIDIIPAEPIEEPKQEETKAEQMANEGETAPTEGGEPKADEPKKEPDKIADDVATKVEEQVKEDDVTDATEIAKIVKETVEAELANKYQPLIDLVNKCGGKEKLEGLLNVKHENQTFETKQETKKASYTIAELMAMKKK